MNRIVVSPKAVSVARLLRSTVAAEVEATVRLSQSEMSAATGLADDTVYRALVELAELRAVADFSRPDAAGVRTVVVNVNHWLFAAVKQGERLSLTVSRDRSGLGLGVAK